MSEPTDCWRDLIAASLTEPSQYKGRNFDYEGTLPKNPFMSANDSIGDFEPHCGGIGYYDDPDEAVFEHYYWPSWRPWAPAVPTVHVRRLSDALNLALGNFDDWMSIFHFIRPTGTVSSSVDIDNVVADCIIQEGDGSGSADPLPCQLRHVVWDFDEFKDNTGLSVNSVALLSLFLAMPNIESLCIRNLSMDPDKESNFAHFPSPLPSCTSFLDEIGIPQGFAIAPRLKTIQFSKCDLSSADIFYLGDCAIHNAVFPLLRNIKFYYCGGMSGSSIMHLSPTVNMSFDRWECSGFCWPQEPINPKNMNVHY
jgi:hypothetical protein